MLFQKTYIQRGIGGGNMSVYKDATRNSWYVKIRYTDYYGKKKQTTKRGFKTKREASEWEAAEKLKKNFSLDMPFSKFYEIYEADLRHRIKQTTWENKNIIITTKILPYFGERKMTEITPKDVRHWQKKMIEYTDEDGKSYSQAYLATLHVQLSAIFNHAVKFYDLKNNPAKVAGGMGSKKGGNMMFWTQDEYKKFINCVMDKPLSFYGFEILYWCGLRIGDDDDKIRLNQRKPSKYKGLSRFGPEKNLQRINKFMKERPTFYKKLIQMKENFRFYLRCFYCITKVVILQFNSEKQDRISS